MKTFEGDNGGDERDYDLSDILDAVPSDDTLRADIDSATAALSPIVADELAAREVINRVKSVLILGMLEERGVASARVVAGEFTRLDANGNPVYEDMSALATHYDTEFS